MKDLKIAFYLVFIASFLWSLIGLLLPLYLVDIGINGFQLGFLISLLSILGLLVAFPTGIINDKWSIRRAVSIAYVLLSVFFFGLSFFDSFSVLILFFILGGVGKEINKNSIRSFIYKIKTLKEGKKFGVFSCVEHIGMGLGLFVSALIISFFNFNFMFLITGVIFLFLIPFVYRFRPVQKYKIRLIQYPKEFFKKAKLLSLALFLFTLHWGAESTSYSLFLKNNLGLNVFWTAVYISIPLIIFGLFALKFGTVIDKKINFKFLFLLGLVVSGAGHILMTCPLVWLSFMFRILHEIGDAMVEVAMLFWISKLFSFKTIGGESGLIFTLAIIGRFIGALIFAPIGFYWGYHYPFILSGVVIFASAGLFCLLSQKKKI
ncbi:MAG: hypothetical protein DRP16_00460 [Candidatus Aenigmatarchaeota archaeon]|nr:MAG: hypothetical protein DRP16_00460 [Candidatus Aenigmarchaeota archaeon]